MICRPSLAGKTVLPILPSPPVAARLTLAFCGCSVKVGERGCCGWLVSWCCTGIWPRRLIERYVSGERRASLSAAFTPFASEEEGATEAKEHNDEPHEKDTRRNDGFGTNRLRNVSGHPFDGARDLVSGLAAWGREETFRRMLAIRPQASRSAKRECVVVEQRKVHLRVVRNPVQAFLDASNLQADQAVENTLDRIMKNGPTESIVEDLGGFVDENVEGVVDGSGGCVDPSKDVGVDVAVRFRNDLVRTGGPLRGRVVQHVDNLSRKVSHFVRKRGDFLLDSFEQDELT